MCLFIQFFNGIILYWSIIIWYYILFFEPVHFDQVVGTCSCIKVKHLKVQILEYGMLHLDAPLFLALSALWKLSTFPVQFVAFRTSILRDSAGLMGEEMLQVCMRLGSIVAQFVDGALVHGHISEMALVPAATHRKTTRSLPWFQWKMAPLNERKRSFWRYTHFPIFHEKNMIYGKGKLTVFVRTCKSWFVYLDPFKQADFIYCSDFSSDFCV